MKRALIFLMSATLALAFVISDVRFEGLKNLSEDFALSIIGNVRGMEASVSLINSLKERLLKSGYFKDVSALLDTDENGNIILIFRVEENPILREWDIDIQGPSLLKEDDLASAVTLKEGTILNLNEVKESAQKLLDLYRQEGYALVEVKPEVGEGTLTFHVIEYALWDVRFEGLDGLDATSLKEEVDLKTLKEYEELPWWMKIFRDEKECYPKIADIQRAVSVLQKKVYFKSVELNFDKAPSKKPAVILVFRVRTRKLFEGERDLSLRLEGVSLLDPDELKEKIWKDGKKSSIDVLLSAQKVLDEYERAGYMMTWVDVSVEGSEAVFHVYEKYISSVELVYEKGGLRCGESGECPFKRTRPILVRDLLYFKVGDPLKRDALQASFSALARSQYFEKVDILPLGDRKSTQVALQVVLHEKERRFQFMGGAGWGPPEEGEPWWTGLMGQLQLSTVNPFGLGQKASVSLNLGIESRSVKFDYSLPRPFDFPLSVSFGAGYTQDYEGDRTTLSLSAQSLPILSNTLGGGISVTVSTQTELEFFLTHTFDTRNAPFLATEGFMSSERFQAPFDLSRYKIWQIGEISVPLLWNFRITVRDFAGMAYQDVVYPLPGWGVRGQSVSGERVLRLSGELRYRIGGEFPADLVLFYDWGRGDAEVWSSGIGFAAVIPVLGEVEVGYAYMSSKGGFDIYFGLGVMPWSTSSGVGM